MRGPGVTRSPFWSCGSKFRSFLLKSLSEPQIPKGKKKKKNARRGSLSSLHISLAAFLGLQQAQARKTHLVHQSFLNLAEIADGPSLFASRNDVIQLRVLTIRADGSKRGQPHRSNAAGKTARGDETKIPQSSDGKSSDSSNREEIIALFRRIQSSISKGESLSAEKRSSKSEDKSADSVLEVLRQSRKQEKEKAFSKKRATVLSQRRGLLKKDQKTEDHPSISDPRLTRPPSNFVKRSPIPSPSRYLRGKGVEMKREALPTTAGSKELELQKIEEMKLPALKELAKSRGIKGYSKLKKSELVELLRCRGEKS